MGKYPENIRCMNKIALLLSEDNEQIIGPENLPGDGESFKQHTLSEFCCGPYKSLHDDGIPTFLEHLPKVVEQEISIIDV